MLQVDEFCKSAPAHHLRHPNDGVYLVWKWNWSNSSDSLPSPCVSDSECGEHSTEADVCDSESDVCDASESDTVRFKVIGVTRDDKYQQVLEKANDLIHASDVKVHVAVFQEPDNPVDAKAVSFKSMGSGMKLDMLSKRHWMMCMWPYHLMQ